MRIISLVVDILLLYTIDSLKYSVRAYVALMKHGVAFRDLFSGFNNYFWHRNHRMSFNVHCSISSKKNFNMNIFNKNEKALVNEQLLLDFVHSETAKQSIVVSFRIHKNKSNFCHLLQGRRHIFGYQSWTYWYFSFTNWYGYPYELEWNLVLTYFFCIQIIM